MASNEQENTQKILKTLMNSPLLYDAQGREKCDVLRGVVYKRIDNKELLMDVYAPADAAQGVARAVVIHVSGGGETKNWRVFKDYGAVTAARGMIMRFSTRLSVGYSCRAAR